jgi:hypothetical protein
MLLERLESRRQSVAVAECRADYRTGVHLAKSVLSPTRILGIVMVNRYTVHSQGARPRLISGRGV